VDRRRRHHSARSDIGDGSIVLRDVLPGTVVAGNPLG